MSDVNVVNVTRIADTSGASVNLASIDDSGNLSVKINSIGSITVPISDGGSSITVDATSLPLPTGAATAAKQPALGSAGASSTDVITVQGITSMVPLKVDGSASTQPISGTIGLSETILDGASATSAKAFIVAGKDGSSNAQMLSTDTSGNLNVNIISGASSDSPTNPVSIYAKTTDLAAGASTTTAHQTSDLSAGTYYCSGFDVSSSIPLKAALHTVSNGTQSTNPIVVVFSPAGGYQQWKPPHKMFAPFTSSNTAGFDGFRIILTNLDGSEAADVYSTIYYQS